MADEQEKIVTQAELARIIGISRQSVNEQVAKGMYDRCFNVGGTRLYLAKAVTVYNRSLSANQSHRKVTLTKEQKAVKKVEKAVKKLKKVKKEAKEAKEAKETLKPRPSKPSKPAIEVRPEVRMRNGKPVRGDEVFEPEPPPFAEQFSEDDNAEVYNEDNVKELKKLLRTAQSPMHRAQIESTFWQGKTRRLSFLEAERALIPIAEAKEAVNAIFTPINIRLDNMPVQMKAHFPEISDETVKWLWDEINDIKTQSEKEWGEDAK